MLSVDALEGVVRRFDDVQQRHRWLAQPIGVIRKYADDRGSALASLLTYQVFLGMLPLLVVALTVFGRILDSSEELRSAVLDSTFAQFPVVGDRLQDNVEALDVGGAWLYVSLAGLLWSATGIYNSFQLAVNQVWNVTGVYRQGFFGRLLRSVLLVSMVVAAAIGTTAVRRWIEPETGVAAFDLVVSFLSGSIIATGLLLGVLRLAAAPKVDTAALVPAAVAAGVMWTVIRRLGEWIVGQRLTEARDIYGAIAFVVVTLFWINLLARSVILANEIAVVAHRQLWPRRITQPPLSPADREVLVGLVANERRRPEQRITIEFEDGPTQVLEGDVEDGDR